MSRVVHGVFGQGQIGRAIAMILEDQGAEVRRFDMVESNDVNGLDATNPDSLDRAVGDVDICYSALPYDVTTNLAMAVARNGGGRIYLDLTEDLEVGQNIQRYSENSQNEVTFIPHCGLAPGAVSIIAASMARDFQEVTDIKIRVGALPIACDNILNYQRSWSTSGLINEYLKPAERIQNGQYRVVDSLSNIERVSLHGEVYEAFTTSGGSGTLIDSVLDNKIPNMSMECNVDYKTLRYPGHCEKMWFLLHELGFKDHVPELSAILDRQVKRTLDDVVVIWIEVTGRSPSGDTYSRSYARKVKPSKHLTAIQRTTAGGIIAAAMWAMKQKNRKTFYRNEEISLFEVQHLEAWQPFA